MAIDLEEIIDKFHDYYLDYAEENYPDLMGRLPLRNPPDVKQFILEKGEGNHIGAVIVFSKPTMEGMSSIDNKIIKISDIFSEGELEEGSVEWNVVIQRIMNRNELSQAVAYITIGGYTSEINDSTIRESAEEWVERHVNPSRTEMGREMMVSAFNILFNLENSLRTFIEEKSK